MLRQKGVARNGKAAVVAQDENQHKRTGEDVGEAKVFVQGCGCPNQQEADSTLRSSRAVPHPSTNRALRRLTSEV